MLKKEKKDNGDIILSNEKGYILYNYEKFIAVIEWDILGEKGKEIFFPDETPEFRTKLTQLKRLIGGITWQTLNTNGRIIFN